VFGWIANLIEWIPIAVLAPILIFVAINITMQAFEATPQKYFGAVVIAFFPPIARMLAIKLGDPGIVPPDQFAHLFAAAEGGLPELAVIVMLGNGFIITSMVWASFVVALIDHRPYKAAAIVLLGAGLTLFGVIHSVEPGGDMYLPWLLDAPARALVWQFVGAYTVLPPSSCCLPSCDPRRHLKAARRGSPEGARGCSGRSLGTPAYALDGTNLAVTDPKFRLDLFPQCSCCPFHPPIRKRRPSRSATGAAASSGSRTMKASRRSPTRAARRSPGSPARGPASTC
jgi:hypothetical protein